MLCNLQVATALGMESIDIKGASHGFQPEHGMLLKTTTTTPVPMETVLVPVETAPAVAVSGVHLLPPAVLQANVFTA